MRLIMIMATIGEAKQVFASPIAFCSSPFLVVITCEIDH